MIVIIVEGCRGGSMKISTQSRENRTQSLVVGEEVRMVKWRGGKLERKKPAQPRLSIGS